MIDDDRHGPDEHGDDFWGNTPDWTDAADRPHRERRERRSDRHTDITGAIKNLWGSAMTGGASVTRSHGVFDATAPRPVDAPDPRSTAGPNPAMFDDLDLDFDDVGFDVEREIDPGATTEVPVIDARLRRISATGAAAPGDSGRRIDPLLARVGAVAVVTTLLVPLAIGLRSGGSDDIVTSADVPAAAAPIIEPAQSAASAESADPESADPQSAASVALDPSTLPRAVPANSDASTEAPASTDTDAATTSTDPGISTGPSSDSADSGATTASDSDEAKAGAVDADTTAVTVAGASSDPVCAVDYIVQSGDYWIGIADGAGVPFAEVLEANSATPSTPLYPGADICLPAGSTVPSTTAPPATTPATTPPTTPAPTPTTPTAAAPTTDVPTTAAPTTSPPAAPAPSPAGPEEIKQIIRDVWPDELEEKALTIAFRESSYVPTAKNFCCYGLFQIYWEVHDGWLSGIGVTDDDQLYDPATNARAAYALYQRAGGWGPWSQTNY